MCPRFRHTTIELGDGTRQVVHLNLCFVISVTPVADNTQCTITLTNGDRLHCLEKADAVISL